MVTPMPSPLAPAASTAPTPPTDALQRDCGLYDAVLATITGRVTDATGAPLSGVTVIGSLPGEKGTDPCLPETYGKDAVWQGVTSADGVYTIRRVRPSTVLVLTVRRDGQELAKTSVLPVTNLQGDPNLNRFDITVATATPAGPQP